MSDEIVDQVDENDEIIGERLKSECHKKGLWHRGAAIFVFNKEGELLIQKRGPNMRRPNLLCSSAAGHLHKGESYGQGAKRELFEELGIEADFHFVGKFSMEEDYPNNEVDREHYALYICDYDGEIKVQEEELASAHFYPMNNLKQMIDKNREQFTFGFLEEFRHYLQWVENTS